MEVQRRGRIMVQWTPVTGVTKYNVQFIRGSGVGDDLNDVTSRDVSSGYISRSLLPNTEYSVRVFNAKGLEFDHVVVLDGSWERVGASEDANAPRRLYYVAMTRARKTLTLARFPRSHPFRDFLQGIPSVLHPDGPAHFPSAPPELSRRYRSLSLRDVFLSFAGYRPQSHSVHNAIANLSPGELL